MSTDVKPPARELDGVLLAVLANRFEAIVREMTNTLFRTGRSSVLNMARDFSCSIVTAENELLAAAEGLQVHVLGAGLQTDSMRELHPDLAEGDAFLHNDPYLGNTHTADFTRPRPRLPRGRARLHRLRQGPSGRLRQRRAEHLHALRDATSTRRGP